MGLEALADGTTNSVGSSMEKSYSQCPKAVASPLFRAKLILFNGLYNEILC